MNFKKLVKSCLWLLLVVPSILYGQGQGDNMTEVKRIMEEMKTISGTAYDYSLNVHYPNDQKDHIKGEIFIDNSHKFLYNGCDAFTMIYSNHWFYKADHRQKTVTVVNLDKEYKNDLKSGVEKDVFENGSVTTFIDSVLLKYATIKSFNKKGDIVKTELVFPKGMKVKNINLVYDEKKKALVSYSMGMFQPMRTDKNKAGGINQEMSCSNFRKTGKKKHSTDDFFSFNNGKIMLKKYNKYKLYTKL